ncbi:hypothetical protein [Streptomyces brasiliscabiei]|uniref:hypothetical protein n=1 Tax=Streptomyces brasiliscabiei TaxID=2736302 RepID=UPI001C1220E0|nr:hypothetical protein [Streptomyces brasiliscabiei]
MYPMATYPVYIYVLQPTCGCSLPPVRASTLPCVVTGSLTAAEAVVAAVVLIVVILFVVAGVPAIDVLVMLEGVAWISSRFILETRAHTRG